MLNFMSMVYLFLGTCSKTLEIRIPIVRNTRLFVINLGLDGFSEYGYFANYFL